MPRKTTISVETTTLLVVTRKIVRDAPVSDWATLPFLDSLKALLYLASQT
jgi:hypothetical protein